MMKKLTVLAFALYASSVTFAAPADLEKAFDAAVKAGKPLEAEQAFKRLTEEASATSPIRYYQAAEVARQTGKYSLYRDRLAHYLRVEKGWNENVARALKILCRSEPTAERFSRLSKNIRKDDVLFDLGYEMLRSLRLNKRGEESVKMAEEMFATFKETDRREKILEEMVELVKASPNFPAAKMFAMLEKFPLADVKGFADFVDRNKSVCTPEWLFDYCARHKCFIYPVTTCCWWLLGRDASSEKNAARRDALLAGLKRVMPQIAEGASASPYYAILFYRVAIAYPKTFFTDCVENAESKKVSSSQAMELFKKIPVRHSDGNYVNLIHEAIGREIWSVQDRRSIVAANMKVINAGYVLRYGSERDMIADATESKSTARLEAFIDSMEKSGKVSRVTAAQMRTECISLFASTGNARAIAETLKSIARLDMYIHMNYFYPVIRDAKISDTQKINFFRDAWKICGSTEFFKDLVSRFEADADKAVKDFQEYTERQKAIAAKQKKPFTPPKREKKLLGENPAFKAFAKEVLASKSTASDKFVRLSRAMAALPKPKDGVNCPPAAHEIAREATAAYPSLYPAGPEFAVENKFYSQIIEKYREYCSRSKNGADKIKYVETLMPKQSKDSPFWGQWGWNMISWSASRAYMNGFILSGLKAGCQPNWIFYYKLDKDTKEFPKQIDFAKLPAPISTRYISENIYNKNLVGKAAEEGVLYVLKTRPIGDVEPSSLTTVLDYLSESVTNAQFAAAIDVKGLTGKYISTAATRDEFSRARTMIVAFKRLGNSSESVKAYLASARKLDNPSARFNAVQALLSMRIWRKTGWEWAFSDADDPEKREKDDFALIMKNDLLPVLKSVKNSDAPLFSMRGSTDFTERLVNYLERQKNAAKSGRSASVSLAEEILDNMVRLVKNGAISHGSGALREILFTHAYVEALAVTNVPAMNSFAYDLGASWDNRTSADRAKRILKKTHDVKAWESVYLIANALGEDVSNDIVSFASRYRATVARKLPGIFPVSEKDPAYPLYVAADELSRNNPEGATKLLRQNLGVFEREAVNLPPDFTAWAVDQIRLERGKKDELVVKARQIATQVLANESKITSELAAAMLLVRAETFRDQQNFEAAKLEYQSIRNNPVYHKTASGRKAMFRAVGLMIDTGNSSAAEATLEYWLSQPDAEIQAEAHCFLAKIAFERKDYDECIKQLREVFAIDFTHTEARFLQGKWKLATNSEVDDVEVLIGNISDRTAVRPGQQLSITVQDRNLSVAGGGSSIPVVVTSSGGDRENVFLYPSPRDPNLFKGVIDVKLGNPVASNLVLEVRGSDTASYVIDPAFLTARGLPLNEPKVLSVVDDARLAIGTGAPRTDEDQSRSQVEAMVSDSGGSDSWALAMNLRPGNPLYIAVSDKDRSLGGDADSVDVEVSTTSGDILKNVQLKETGKCTGLFRGIVPTALPPPRAFASDTAVGFNPGDVINSTRDGKWKSIADGQPGKWFEVDTMGSHLVSEVKIKMPSPSEITAVRISGSLGGEGIRLGSLPAQDPALRLGLKAQFTRHQGFRGISQIRAFMDKPDAPSASSVTQVAFRVRWPRQRNTARYMGAFVQPKGYDYLRMRIEAFDTTGDALQRASAMIAIDGKQVFSGHGASLHNRYFACEMSSGAHRFELFASGFSPKDNFRVLWEPLGTDGQPVPMDWFSVEKNPELLEFVSDRAKIERTADGFVARMVKPVRLRTIKWDFLGRTSPDVTIDSLSAVNSAGETILPVQTDFSDAQHNDLLEVAPGDRINVKYIDKVTSSGTRKVLEKTMNSSFNDAQVGFRFEELCGDETGDLYTVLREAYRFVPGDVVLVSVIDSDLDVSSEADRIKVTVESKSGTKREITLVEQKISGNGNDLEGIHSGRFLGMVRTKLSKDVAEGDNKHFPVEENDTLILSYEDRENTNPGVPCVRTAQVQSTKQAVPMLTLFHARNVRSIDNSADAKARLALIRRRPGNENVKHLYRNDVVAIPMSKNLLQGTNAVAVNVAAPVLVRVNDPSRARHAGSKLRLEVTALSELKRAEEAGEEPNSEETFMRLGAEFGDVKLRRGGETAREARTAGSFNGMAYLVVGTVDTASEEILAAAGRLTAVPKGRESPALLGVNGNDEVRIRVFDGETILAEKMLSLTSNASLSLLDSSWKAERLSAHVGERFFVQIRDADLDTTDQPDRVRVDVKSIVSGLKRQMVLTETVPHSGVFNGIIKPYLFPPDEMVPLVVTGGVASTEMMISEDRFSVRFGDILEFSYRDENTLPGTAAGSLCVTGTVYQGSDGSVRMYSKRFRDYDQAVLVQFRLAECLFEQAKEHRKLKHPEKSADCIARGRFILEEALKNFPDSVHVVQGEYLLANLYQELAIEQRESKNIERARELFSEALARFSQILAVWPEGDFAARSQYHKALCLEMLGDYNRAGEEYVKMTYLYPESDLVGDATIRLATYYYKEEKRFDISARIYENFQKRFPNHDKAPRALFMCGSCFVKQAESIYKKRKEKGVRGGSNEASLMYQRAVKAFEELVEKYRTSTTPELKAQALYWAGDISLRRGASRDAYVFLKRTVLEYPETEWARRARGLLLQEGARFTGMEDN